MESVPLDAAEGENVLLCVHNLSEKFSHLEWFRGELLPENKIATLRTNPEIKTDGPVLKGRKKLYSNGSLEIQNVAIGDSGTYLIRVTTVSGDIKRGSGMLRVYAPVALPLIQASNTTVTEGAGPVVLTCLTSDTQISIRWLLNNTVLQSTERRMLSANNRTLTLQPVMAADEGNYQCDVSNRVSSRKSAIFRLQVTPFPREDRETPLVGFLFEEERPIIPQGSYPNFSRPKGKTV